MKQYRVSLKDRCLSCIFRFLVRFSSKNRCNLTGDISVYNTFFWKLKSKALGYEDEFQFFFSEIKLFQRKV